MLLLRARTSEPPLASWVATALALLLIGCSHGATASRDGAGGAGGSDADSCGYYGAPKTSTLRGLGFDDWEGGVVEACFDPSQPVAGPACGEATVIGGAFTITKSVCTGIGWQVQIYSSRGKIVCDSRGTIRDATITPASCWCLDVNPASMRPVSECGGDAAVDAGDDAAVDAGSDSQGIER
jgi:hypothetical protein